MYTAAEIEEILQKMIQEYIRETMEELSLATGSGKDEWLLRYIAGKTFGGSTFANRVATYFKEREEENDA